MSWNQIKQRNYNSIDRSENYSLPKFIQKPLEVYLFIDPLCPECWSLEPYLKKLSIEYGRFFTIRPIVITHICPVNGVSNNTRNKENHTNISFPLTTSLAIKAAELQGNSAGRTFLRKVQEKLFLKNKDVSNENVLIRCAEEANLDIDEFKNDLASDSAKKALQCDIKIMKDMKVDYAPTIVFFNQRVEEEGIKISGTYPYHIYVLVLSKMLRYNPIPTEKPNLEEFLSYYKIVANEEISVVYDWHPTKIDKEMKKLKLKQKVIKKPVKFSSFWIYNSK